MVLPISKLSSTSSTGSSVSSLSSYTFSDDTVKSGGGGSSHGRSSSSSSNHGGSGANAVKFLCSYGGKILPRYPEKNLRYVGGDTRVLAVDRSISFSELVAKMADLCGWGTRVALRCQLPSEDLDALVTVSSDEDLANIIEVYDLASSSRKEPERQYKIRAFLLPIQPQQQQPKSPSSPSSAAASPPSSDKGKSPFLGSSPPRHCSSAAASPSYPRRMSPPPFHHHHQHHRHLHHLHLNHQHHHNHHHQLPQIPVAAAAATPYVYHHVMAPVQLPAAASCRHPHNFPLAHTSSHQWR